MKANPHHYAVIMAGGGGERFWPLSRLHRPKQLLALVTRRTLIEETVARLGPLFRHENILIITNRVQAARIRGLFPRIPPGNIIAEPLRRDTATAVGLGAEIVARRDPRGVIAVLPADHVVRDTAAYRRVLADCLRLAGREPLLVTIGIRPTEPHTGYGYIEVSPHSPARLPRAATRFWWARRFVEKPDRATAKRYLAAGRHRWNAGMFVWSVGTIRAALQRHLPDLASALATIRPSLGSSRLSAALARLYPTLPRISIDYGLMEKADNVVVAEGRFDWDDVGSWLALERHLPADAARNIVRGPVVCVRSGHNIVFAEKRLVATLGVRDLIIVETADALLVCHREEAQKIKEVVALLAQRPATRRLI